MPERDQRTDAVETVLGPVSGRLLGQVAVHEHLVLDLAAVVGDDDMRLGDPATLPGELRFAAAAGVGTILDLTTRDMGRDVSIVLAASQGAEVHVVMSTGYYHNATYPERVRTADQEALADEFVREATQGIGDSGVRAGVIGELGTEGAEFTDVERKMFRAAASAHLRTGLPIITHTMNGACGWEQAVILMAAGVDPSRVTIGHLDSVPDATLAIRLAEEGFFVAFDRCGSPHSPLNDDARVGLVLKFCDAGHADRLVLSADVGRQSRLHSSGGLGYATVALGFLPRLRRAGVDEATIEQLTVTNPRQLLAGGPS